MQYLVLVALISGGFVIAMKTIGERGNYLAGPYMFAPAIAAFLTRTFFSERGFSDARLGPGRWGDYFRFWAITVGIVVLSYIFYTITGSIEWDAGGDTFEYTGTGIEKLLGFLVAIVFLAVYVGILQLLLFYAGLSVMIDPETASPEELIAQTLAIYLTFLAVLPFLLYAIYR